MGAGSHQQHHQFGFVFVPNKQPIGLDVAFPTMLELSGKFMRLVLGWQTAVFFKQLHHFVEGFHVIASLLAALEVLLERPSVFNGVHQSFISWLNKSLALVAV